MTKLLKAQRARFYGGKEKSHTHKHVSAKAQKRQTGKQIGFNFRLLISIKTLKSITLNL